MSENQFCSKCGAQLQPGSTFCPNCGAPVGQASGPTTAPLSGVDALMKESGAQNYWLRRFVAFVIDAVIVGVILVVVAVAVAIPSFALSGSAGVTSFFAGAFAVVAGVILFLYFIVAEVTRGATVGKHAMHLKVVGPKGGNPTLIESLVRNVSKIYLDPAAPRRHRRSGHLETVQPEVQRQAGRHLGRWVKDSRRGSSAGLETRRPEWTSSCVAVTERVDKNC